MSPAEARRTLTDVVRGVDGLLTRPSVIALRGVAACEQTHTSVIPVLCMFHGNLMCVCVCVYAWFMALISHTVFL